MIIGAHAVIASNDAAADHKFFTEVFGLTSVDAGGGYMILGLPASEASVHPAGDEAPRHELFFLCDDVDKFVAEMTEKQVECDPLHDAGWGRVVKIKLPSGAPLNVYEPRHARP